MGKVEAVRYADLSFETALPIKSISVVNGQQVRKGEVLAQLELFELQNAVELQRLAVEQANLQIEQAELMMKDVIIAHGYDPDQKSTVPQQVIHLSLGRGRTATLRREGARGFHQCIEDFHVGKVLGTLAVGIVPSVTAWLGLRETVLLIAHLMKLVDEVALGVVVVTCLDDKSSVSLTPHICEKQVTVFRVEEEFS